jgi:hypothetical protein
MDLLLDEEKVMREAVEVALSLTNLVPTRTWALMVVVSYTVRCTTPPLLRSQCLVMVEGFTICGW